MFQTCILGNNSCQEFFPLLKKRWGTRSSFLSLCKMSHDKSQPNADFPPYQMNYFLAEKNATRFCFFSDACIKKCEAKNPLNPTISLGIFCTNSPWHFPCKISQWKKSEHVYWHKIFTFFFLVLVRCTRRFVFHGRGVKNLAALFSSWVWLLTRSSYYFQRFKNHYCSPFSLSHFKLHSAKSAMGQGMTKVKLLGM